MGIIAWLVGSKLGRAVAGIVLISAAILLAITRIFAAGRAKERMKQTQHTLKVMKKAIQVDEEISSLSNAERRERLRKWVSD